MLQVRRANDSIKYYKFCGLPPLGIRQNALSFASILRLPPIFTPPWIGVGRWRSYQPMVLSV
jgi:hypothetical protein